MVGRVKGVEGYRTNEEQWVKGAEGYRTNEEQWVKGAEELPRTKSSG
jgi:ribosomal protein L20